MAINLNDENKQWIDDFHNKNKRSPQIIHLSNVANNAYNNAKLLNECGITNHVLTYNDYFAMGCPEWEDADFSNEITDMWNPEWVNYDLNGFKRPRWFAQGDLDSCINYLLALCLNNETAEVLFNILAKQNKTQYSEEIKTRLTTHVNVVLRSLLSNSTKNIKKIVRDQIIKIDNKFQLKLLNNLSRIKTKSHRIISHLKKKTTNESDNPFGPFTNDDYLIADFKNQFPTRSDLLSQNDFINYYYARPLITKLLQNYDIIMGYAIEGIYPLMSNIPYIAFEHGTIRDIPYAQDTQGRICALTYRKANHVFVTNFDCLKSAEFLAPNRFSLINHPYDEDQPLSINNTWQQQQLELREALDADRILFHPTRHDWLHGTGYADKANDEFLKAFIAARKQGLRFGLVCCEWGANIEQSKAMLHEAGMTPYVRWVKPLGIMAYTKMCKIADIVVDQFKLGGFGGVTFKALAAAAPVMAYINNKQVMERYAEAPPVINCRTTEEIFAELRYWYDKPNELKSFGMSGREWMKKYHNKNETINIQIDQFRRHYPVNKNSAPQHS